MRQCGDCQLCCKLLPVRSLEKAAGQRCRHQRHHKGCAVYARLDAVSPECRGWSCRWLVEDDTADLRRPDRAGYVLDLMPDHITIQNNETGEEQHVQVVQIWAARPDWRDEALGAYLLRRGKEGVAAIVRFNATDAILVFPPNMSSDGQWHEIDGSDPNGPSVQCTREHSIAETVAALGGRLRVTIQEG